MFAVFLDIKRAYSITWKHGIPMILYYIGLRIHPKLKVNATKGLFSIFFMPYFGVQTAQHFCGFTEHLFIINLTMVVSLSVWISQLSESWTQSIMKLSEFVQGLLGAFRSSHVESLHTESGAPPHYTGNT